jgi:hypothetical protein
MNHRSSPQQDTFFLSGLGRLRIALARSWATRPALVTDPTEEPSRQ